jgi:hypothetical protein
MLANKTNKFDKMYEQGIRNYSKILGCSEGGYRCPLCGFLKHKDELSNEHAPIKALGGKVVILTCKSCNNDRGADIDSHAAREKNQTVFRGSLYGLNREIFESKVCIEINKIKFRGDVTINAKGGQTQLAIIVRGKYNNPNSIAQNRSYLKTQSESLSAISMTVSSPPNLTFSERKSKLSHLKSAFLLVTAALGYAFSLNPLLTKIRHQLIFTGEDMLEPPVFYQKADKNYIACSQSLEVIIVKHSSSLVVLPHPQSTFEVYSKTLNRCELESKFTFDCKYTDWPTDFKGELDNNPDCSFKVINN